MNDNTGPTVGMNVRRARRYAGLTLEQLAGQIGKSKGWLSMVENGRLALEKRQDIARIAEVLAASASAMIMLRHFGRTDLAWVAADRGLRPPRCSATRPGPRPRRSRSRTPARP